VLVDCLVGLALLGGLLACLVVDGLGRSLVDRRLLQLTINLEEGSPAETRNTFFPTSVHGVPRQPRVYHPRTTDRNLTRLDRLSKRTHEIQPLEPILFPKLRI